jgi:hypothetical protein
MITEEGGRAYVHVCTCFAATDGKLGKDEIGTDLFEDGSEKVGIKVGNISTGFWLHIVFWRESKNACTCTCVYMSRHIIGNPPFCLSSSLGILL